VPPSKHVPADNYAMSAATLVYRWCTNKPQPMYREGSVQQDLSRGSIETLLKKYLKIKVGV